MMKILIALMCCKWRQNYADAQRDTWIKDIPEGVDYKFFFGNGMGREPNSDEIFVNCPDEYRGLPAKVWRSAQWAVNNNYDYIAKIDDDVYVRPERLLNSGFENHDYIGRYFGGNFACGLAYWISSKSAKILADASEPIMGAEDQWVGKTLFDAGITCHEDDRYRLVARVRPGSKEFVTSSPEYQNDMIAAAEFPGAQMYEPHKIWQDSVTEYNNIFESIRI